MMNGGNGIRLPDANDHRVLAIETQAIEVLELINPHAYLYIGIDETGDLGTSEDSDWYILCASSVINRDQFEEVIRRYGSSREMKFRKQKKNREEILRKANPLVERIYYVAVRKQNGNFSPDEKHFIHEFALRKLSEMIISQSTVSYLDVEIDHTSMIDDDVARNIFLANNQDSNWIDAEVSDSKNSYSLQTNDFIVGAIGRMFKRNPEQYHQLLDAPKQGYIIGSERIRSYGPVETIGQNENAQANRSQEDHADAFGQIEYGPIQYLKPVIRKTKCGGFR